MSTKIITALVNGVVQQIEVEDIISAEQGPSVEDRLVELEDKPIIADGNMLVGNGTEDLVEITPENVLSHINGASVQTMTTEEYEALGDADSNANTLYVLTDSEDESYTSTEIDEKIEVINKSIDDSAKSTLDDAKFYTDTVADGKANKVHNHDDVYETKTDANAKVENLESAIDGKANSSHTHVVSDVTNLQTALDGKANSSHNHDTVYAKKTHTHAISDVTNLQSTLDGKAASNHNHDTLYDAKGSADTALDSAKEYTDTVASGKANANHSHSVATTSNDGFMSSTDKTKLDGIATGANKTVVDSSLSSTSTNPVQNKVINSALSGKVPTSRTINGKSLSANISLSASDVGADASGSAENALTSANSYTDTKIANLINGAPTTLDTLGEIATAMDENADVVQALNDAIGTKADASALTSHTGNKSNPHGVTKSQVGLGNVGNFKAVSTVASQGLTDTEKSNARANIGAETSGAANTALASAKSYTDTEVAKKANSSHSHTIANVINLQSTLDGKAANTDMTGATANVAGTHGLVPAPAKGNQAKFLRGDGTWQTPTNTTYGAAGSSLGLVKSGGDVTISNGVITVNDDSHTHTIANIDNLQTTIDTINSEIDGSIKSLSVSGKTITYTKNDGTTGTITTQDTNTDTKVTNTLATTTKAYVTGTTSATTNTGTQVFDTGVYLDTTAGKLTATTFSGSLSGNATSATKATQDASGNTITSTYETKTDAFAKLTEAKEYTDTEVAKKANTSHTHAIANITNLQSTLDGKAATNHGTHVSYSTTAPVMDGTASVGTAGTVARSDHKHPTDTSRASKTEFDTHDSNTIKHITSDERTKWNAAKTHADSAHAPSNAEVNQNAFSNIKVGDTTIAADTKTDTLTLVAGNNVTITPDTTNDKITISSKDTNTWRPVQNNLTSTSTTDALSAAQGTALKALVDCKVPTSRTINNKALSSDITLSASDVGAAPHGYGLGNYSVLLTSAHDLNNIKTNGWYTWNSDSIPINVPAHPSAHHMSALRITTEYGGTCVQELFGITNNIGIINNLCIRRTIYGNFVNEWEWVNPPMELDVEYRTVERFFSKPVYCTILNLGAMPNKSSMERYGVKSGITRLMSCNFMIKNENTGVIFCGDYAGIDYAYAAISNENTLYFALSTNSDMSAYTIYFVIKYTRE